MERSGGITGAAAWARNDARRRWRALVVLGLLAGITAGFGMAAVAGARRTDSALARLRSQTEATDAIVFSSRAGAYSPDWDKLRAHPEIAAVAVWNLLFGTIDGEPGALLFASNDGDYLGKVNRPHVVAGRMWNPAAADEVVVTETMAKTVPLGATFELRAYGRDENDFGGKPPTGPRSQFEVVGVVRTINQFLFTPEQIFVSPGYMAKYGDKVQILENADVRLRDPIADVPALRRLVNDDIAAGTPVFDLHGVTRRVDTTVDVE